MAIGERIHFFRAHITEGDEVQVIIFCRIDMIDRNASATD